jgi:hypothetical protein
MVHETIAGPAASFLQCLLDVIGFYILPPVLQGVLRHKDKRCSSGMDDQTIKRSLAVISGSVLSQNIAG